MSARILEQHLATHNLALESDPHKHRKLVATKPIAKGTTVISSRPLCNSILFPTHRAQRCETCFKPRTSSKPLLRCSICKKRYYCNRDCFTTAWNGWHRWICDQKDEEDLDHEMLEMVTMFWDRLYSNQLTKPEAQKMSNGESIALTYYVFTTLLGHVDRLNQHQLSQYTTIARKVQERLFKSEYPFKSPGNGNRPPALAEMVQDLCRFHCNNFSIHDSQLYTMAEGTYPIGALFNHSCRPNAIVLYEGQQQIVRTLEDVEEGQEICTSYVDNGVQRKGRRMMLQDKYYFECLCERCIQPDLNEDDESGGKADKKLLQGFRILDELIEGDKDGKDGKTVDGEWLTLQFEPVMFPQLIELRGEAGKGSRSKESPALITRASFTSYILNNLVPMILKPTKFEDYKSTLFGIYRHLLETPHCEPKPFTTTVMTHATSFFDTCLENQAWQLGSRIGFFILAQYLMIYPRHHPLIAIHCFTLAKCLWNDVKSGLRAVMLANEMLVLAETILEVSHGTDKESQNFSLLAEVREFKATVRIELDS